MTEREIKQAFYISKEIRNSERELSTLKRAIRLMVSKKSDVDELIQLARQAIQIEERLEKCIGMREDIKSFVEAIDDEFLREIIKCRYIDCMSWRDTAQMTGGCNSGNGLREMVQRYFRTCDEQSV